MLVYRHDIILYNDLQVAAMIVFYFTWIFLQEKICSTIYRGFARVNISNRKHPMYFSYIRFIQW